MAKQRNAGRRVITQTDANAIAAKAGIRRSRGVTVQYQGINRREPLIVAIAASSALLTVVGLVFVTAPDPASDPFLGQVIPAKDNPDTGEKTYPVAGEFAYPRIIAGTFSGKYTLDKKASAFNTDDPPSWFPTGSSMLPRSPKLDYPAGAERRRQG